MPAETAGRCGLMTLRRIGWTGQTKRRKTVADLTIEQVRELLEAADRPHPPKADLQAVYAWADAHHTLAKQKFDLARLVLEQAERIEDLEAGQETLPILKRQCERIATFEGLLRELEWEICPISEQEECVWCMNRAPDHANDCRLAAALNS